MDSRRGFLQKLALPFAAIPFASARCQAGEQEEQGLLRVAIMGLGGYGSRVAEAMKDCKKAKLVGVVSGTPAKISAWQSKYHIPAKNCYNYETYPVIASNPHRCCIYYYT